MQEFSNKEKESTNLEDNSKIMFSNDKNDQIFKVDNNNILTEFSNVVKYFSNKIKEKIKQNKKKEIFAFILSITGIILYIISLIGCYGDQAQCLSKVQMSFYYRIIYTTLISCICECLLLVLITFRIVSYFHLLYLVPFMILLMLFDQGTSLAHHGYYNCLGFIIIFVIFYFLLCFLFLIIKLIINKKYRIYLPIFFILFILFICFEVYIKINIKCDGWDIGLNNTR